LLVLTLYLAATSQHFSVKFPVYRQTPKKMYQTCKYFSAEETNR